MPIYEYRCEKCGAAFEKLRSLRDSEKVAECPRCGAPEGKRVLSVCFSSVSGGGSGAAAQCGPGGRFT